MYWPSTPMLNRFIRKPIAAASAGDVDHRGLVDDVDHDRGPARRLEKITLQKSADGLTATSRMTRLVTIVATSSARSAPPARASVEAARPHAAVSVDPPSSAQSRTGHRRSQVLRRHASAGRTRRRVGREGSPRSCRTGRSARRGRPRSAAPPGPRAAAVLMWSQIAAWAPTSTPRVGWEAISRTGSPLISRPTMSFCWLPPERARAVVSMPGVRTSYSSTIRSGVLAGAGRGRCSGPCTDGASRLVAEDAVLPQRRVQQQAVPVPVLGDVADAGLAALAGVPARSCPCRRGAIAPGRTRAHAHDRLDQLRLAVALDPGDAEDLAAVDVERDVGEQAARRRRRSA